jgi:hypothetical protein
MLAYERAGKWQEAVGVLQRAESLGLAPNTVMLNTAISAAGKAGQLEVAEGLFEHAMLPDAITYEAFIAACGIAGAPEKVSGGFLYWWLAVWGMLCYVMHTHTHTHTHAHTRYTYAHRQKRRFSSCVLKASDHASMLSVASLLRTLWLGCTRQLSKSGCVPGGRACRCVCVCLCLL